MELSSNPASTIINKTGSWRTYIPATDNKICIGCSTCSKVCPEGCIEMTATPAGQKPKTDYDYCKGCGICATECPVKAIKMSLDKK